MHAAITTVAFRGIETIPVEVQVHIANGLPAMAIVGLADKAVAESRERVWAAAGDRQYCRRPRQSPCHISRGISAGCRNESLPLWLSW